MCCPECEDYIDEDGCCSCTPDEDDSESSRAWEEYDDGGYCVIIPAVDN